MKSAMAEESVIALVLREPALLDRAGNLKAESFSSALLGRVYDQLYQRHQQGLEVSLAVLEDLNQEEMSHMVGILQRQEGPVNEQAFTDCVATICAEHQAACVSSEDDLLALRSRLKERKGIK
jgi:DNA primase